MASTPTGSYDPRNMQPLPTPRTLDLMVVLGGGARDNIWIKDPNKMTIEERRHFDDEVVARAKLIREMKKVRRIDMNLCVGLSGVGKVWGGVRSGVRGGLERAWLGPIIPPWFPRATIIPLLS